MIDTEEQAKNDIVLDTMETIYDLSTDERENVRHELWAVIDAAPVLDGDEFWDAIDAAVAKGLAFTREPVPTA